MWFCRIHDIPVHARVASLPLVEATITRLAVMAFGSTQVVDTKGRGTMANPVVHFEVIGSDGAKLQAFYRDVFGWSIDANNPMQYGMVSAGSERGIGGGIAGYDDP